KNFLQGEASILQFAIAIQDSRFSTLKDTSTITMPAARPLPSPEEDCSFQNSLPAHWVFHQRLAHGPEQFLSARRCDRFKSIILLGAKPNRWSCHPCNMPSAPDCQTWCQAQTLLLETSKT